LNYYEVYYTGSSGKTVREYFQFSHIEELTSFLHRQKLNVIKIKKVSRVFIILQEFFAKNISEEEVVELINHLHIIIKSGLPLHQSLEDLALETDHPKLKKILFTLSKSIESGHSLSSSMEPFHKVFGFSTIYLIRIGEETGTLEQTLSKAKTFLLQSFKLKREVKMALVYPLTILIVATIAIILWFSFVLPQMAEMFDQMQISLPPLTQVLMFISDVVSHSYIYVTVSLMLIFVILYQANKNSKRVHKKLIQLLLQIPLAGKLIKELNVAYITEFLYLAISTGTSLFNAINIIGENMKNIVYKESIQNVAKHLENGLSLSEALQKEQLYNAFTIRMINIGEQSGDLESQLYTISTYYQENVQTASRQMTKVVEPAMIIFIGAVFALIMLGLMGPIFDIVATI